MNERIKKLSLQATNSIPDDVSAEHAMYLFQVKFAELIVRECASVEHYWLSKEDKTAVALRIKEHFGVEL